jgi:hypothetical protein
VLSRQAVEVNLREHMRTQNYARPIRHKTLRPPNGLSEEITRRARIKGIPDADYTRLLIERGLLMEGVEMAMQAPIPPAWWGLCEAVLETRNILRSLAAARDHGTIPKAQVQAKDEIERMKNHSAVGKQRSVARQRTDNVGAN